MQGKYQWRLWAGVAALISGLLFNLTASAQTVTWGVNGVGGSGTWNDSNINWFNGASNVSWPSGGNAIFAGASGGLVTASVPVVSSMTFNTPGYEIQSGNNIRVGTNVLTVTTNADATLNATISFNAPGVDTLVKNGPAALSISRISIFDRFQLNEGEVRVLGSSSAQANYTLADKPGVVLTLAPAGTGSDSVLLQSLAGGGNSGGVVQPNNQARTVTLSLGNGAVFNGKLQNNGAGILSLVVANHDPQTLTNSNTHTGKTAIVRSGLVLSGNGSAALSSMEIISGSLILDNTASVIADRVSNSLGISLDDGFIQLSGNNTTPVDEAMGMLKFNGLSTIKVSQPGSPATQLTFAGLQRQGHGSLDINGPGVGFTGLANGSTGILAPYIRSGDDWATIGADHRIVPYVAYTSDINAGSSIDNVKIAGGGTILLATTTTKGSLILQNPSVMSGQVLDLDGRSLQLSTGGILASGAGGNEIRNGVLSTTAQEMIVVANDNLAIGATIANESSPMTLTKTGTQTLTLSAANTYTGPTAVMQGTLVISSDANLGLGSSILLGRDATLKASADFKSTKSIDAGLFGNLDTAGHQVEFSGAIQNNLDKLGLGTLILSGQIFGSASVYEGRLILPNSPTASASIIGGTLQVAGSLYTLGNKTGTLDIGGPAAAVLTTTQYVASSDSVMRVEFGIGATLTDAWVLPRFSMLSSTGTLQFAFENLGGIKTGVDYPLLTATSPDTSPVRRMFTFAPEMAAKGWAGTFNVTSSSVSVRFSAVPEPSVTAVMFLEGAFCTIAARGCLCKRRKSS